MDSRLLSRTDAGETLYLAVSAECCQSLRNQPAERDHGAEIIQVFVKTFDDDFDTL